ncbi:unnamed protein product [Effrenium voratum]|nr:unnamed protein product [Effrenium voratum]
MVDTRVGSFTPVAEWNFREVQRAHRGRNERRASWDIKPGDRILAVNEKDGQGILSELAEAASLTTPKDLDLRLEREMQDVFGPPERSASWSKPRHPAPSPLPSSRQSTRSADVPGTRATESSPHLAVPSQVHRTDGARRAASVDSPRAPSPMKNSKGLAPFGKTRDFMSTSSLNQAARAMLHC